MTSTKKAVGIIRSTLEKVGEPLNETQATVLTGCLTVLLAPVVANETKDKKLVDSIYDATYKGRNKYSFNEIAAQIIYLVRHYKC